MPESREKHVSSLNRKNPANNLQGSLGHLMSHLCSLHFSGRILVQVCSSCCPTEASDFGKY